MGLCWMGAEFRGLCGEGMEYLRPELLEELIHQHRFLCGPWLVTRQLGK